MISPRSGLYIGRVSHRRLTPRRHAFSYRAFYLLLDLDHPDQAQTRLFSCNRANLLSFHERDHLQIGTGTLRQRVDALLVQSGVDPAGWRVLILCMPRMLGYVFNPLSVYFCYAPDGALRCLLYEVSNTFGQRHTYVVRVDESDAGGDGIVRQACPKSFYVSPFMEMDLGYTFRIREPSDRISIGILAGRARRPVITTLFSGFYRPLSDRSILSAAFANPLLTFKVIAAIHWEALRLWLKGMRIVPRASAPRESVSFEQANDRGVRS